VEIKIIFEDDYLCVVDKPAGVVVNDADTAKGETIQEWFGNKILSSKSETLNSEFGKKGGVVHRLDKDTSGVLILAKTEPIYEGLKKQFMERTTKKQYIALVHGNLHPDTGEISLPIDRHPGNPKKFAVSENLSRMAITEWKVLEKFGSGSAGYTLVELSPHTGRTHQLRVHMQHLHHPIVSDPIYGYLKTWKQDLKWCKRLFLHAKLLEIIHPETQLKLKFEAELPIDLEQARKSLIH